MNLRPSPFPFRFPSLLSLLTLGFFLGLGITSMLAQTAGAGDGSGEEAHAHSKTILDLISDGGPAVWICLLLLVLVTALVIDGFLKLRVEALAPPEQLHRLRELLRYSSYQEAWRFCIQNTSFLCTVVGAGLERIGRGPDAVEHTLEEVSAQQALLLKANLNYLSVIGVVAPMIGLTGTVIGMIEAFNALGAAGIGDPSALATAIGEVLTATASGLLVAIPGFVFYYVFKVKAQTAIMLADGAIYRLFEDIPYDQWAGMTIGEERPRHPASSSELA